MKVHICDFCWKHGEKPVITTHRAKIKGHASLTIDYCDNCKPLVPKESVAFVRQVYNLMGVDLKDTDEELKAKFQLS